MAPPGVAPPYDVLAIAGSLRRLSYNRALLRAAADLVPELLAIEIYQDLASIPPFDEDLEAETFGGPSAVVGLRRRIAQARGVLIAAPEHNQSIPGVLKNAIDWVSRGELEVLEGKPVAIVGTTTGPWGTRISQKELRHVLYAVGAVVMPAPSLFVREAAEVFDEEGRLNDRPTEVRLEAHLRAFANWVRHVDPATETQ